MSFIFRTEQRMGYRHRGTAGTFLLAIECKTDHSRGMSRLTCGVTLHAG